MSSIHSESQHPAVSDIKSLSPNALVEIIEQCSGICCICDEQAEIKYLNQAGTHFFGLELESIIGRSLLDFVHSDDLDVATESIVRLCSQPGCNTRFCTRFAQANGQDGFLTWSFKSDASSRLLYGTAEIENSSSYMLNRGLYRKDLKADYFYLSEELSGIGFWRADLETLVISWTERVFEIHDLPYSDIAPTWQECLAMYHPDDRDKVHQCLKLAVLEGESFSIQFRLLTPKNRQKYVHARGYVESLPNGKPKAIVGTYQDISVQMSMREELQHFSNIVKYSNLSVLVCDQERRISWVNQGFETLTGYTLEEVIGQHPAQLLHGAKTSEQTKEYVRDQLSKGETVDCDVLNYNKAGKSYWIRLTITPIKDDDGNLVKFLGFQTDITQKKHSEEVMRQASHLESLNVMVGGIAHDFNNVLGIAKSNIDLLSSEVEAQQGADIYVKKIAKAVDRAAQLTQKLLQFSKVSHSEKTANHIQACVKDASLLLDKSFAKAIECHLSLEDKPIWCSVNKTDLEDCLINLAINARDAIDYQGCINIVVGLSRPPGNCTVGYLPSNEITQDYCMIAVKDTGSGIAKDDLEKVFTPFFTTKPNGAGTGLGLSMVYNFARQSHGFVGMTSEEGVGTTVYIWLPLCQPAVTKSPQVLPDKSDTKALNILLLDDEMDLLDVTAAILSRDGHQVTSCHNAEMAVQMLSEKSFDLFLSDILMPGEKQPIDVINKIKDTNISTKIMLMSGYQGTNNEALTNFPILQKPFSRDKLLSSIHELFK
ncbi:PAS domain S-box protein [Alteromonas sp. a30]|uniref:PAS domain S-box protein n=1 Tax=Alteromonas sp. a30 TaxID=2730917 RepID=UPI0022828C39|nr:PAS domain S-box protein [Alteromonas sp. a30]MCY7295696.1 PAS domain S-box protein [Alteromonas sp. a30]